MSIVAIVGRPNVGKSTLFNRLTGEKKAIVEEMPGVTRDRIYGRSDWNGKTFTVIDTGGFIPGTEDTMERAIREQAFMAMNEADCIVFVCDGRDGVTPFDLDIARLLRSSKKPVVLVINKCDDFHIDYVSYEFHKLGLGEPYAISALSGRSTGDFLDAVADNITGDQDDEEDTRLKIAVVGRPNAGKSSIVNALTGAERAIVTDIAGTTRDAIDSVIKYYGEEIVLIDTAGLRKRANVKENVEHFSVIRTALAIERCDIAIVVVDATRGLEDQDKKIINQVSAERKGIIIAVNKWDLMEKDSKTADKFTKNVREMMKTFSYLPIVYISALTKQRLPKLLDTAKQIKERRDTRISTGKLNDLLKTELDKIPPPSIKGKDLRINYITQVKTNPPIFAFFCNQPSLIPDHYKRFIENKLRELFDFEGTPVSFIFRRKNTKWEDMH